MVSGARRMGWSGAMPYRVRPARISAGRPVLPSAAVTMNRPPNSTSRCQSTWPSMRCVARLRLTQEPGRHEQHAFDVRQRRGEQGQQDDGIRRLPCAGLWGRGANGPAARWLEPWRCAPDARAKAGRSRAGRRGGPRAPAGRRQQERPELEPAHLADEDVLRVADERGGRAGVGGRARAITNGLGSSSRRWIPVTRSGVIANTTTSLASTAESRPAVTTVSARRHCGPQGVLAIRREDQA